MITMITDYVQKLPDVAVKRALISVSDKTGILEFASKLHDFKIEIISTGGTAQIIRDSGIPVTEVSTITGFPECLDGRVKTLHPMIHGGLLARPNIEHHASAISELGIHPIQLAVINLYPFENTISVSPNDLENAVENIDIGGPAMVRASAKNFENVCIITQSDQYTSVLEEMEERSGSISGETRFNCAIQAFAMTASYDQGISSYLHSKIINHGKTKTPSTLHVEAPLFQILRYGENPHQPAAVYGRPDHHIDCFHGKELSYNNYLDIDAALQMGADFQKSDKTLCAIFKHNLPCGAALADQPLTAWEKAFSTDTVSPFGGIILFNRTIDEETAMSVDAIFSEIILAPDFSDEALALLVRKSNRRLIRIRKWADDSVLHVRSVTGGFLWQHADSGFAGESRKVVTRRQPDQSEWETLEFAWIICKHVKSNAIVYASNLQTVGVGTGQPSRVDSSRIAVQKAKEFGHSLDGSVVASDAFFPFADGLEAAARAGATAVIQPGGSVRDAEVIKKADDLGIAMVFTDTRHFRH